MSWGEGSSARGGSNYTNSREPTLLPRLLVPSGILSSPKINGPKTVARFFGSILFLSDRETILARCSVSARKVA